MVYPAPQKSLEFPNGLFISAYETDTSLHIDDIGFIREIIYRLEQQYNLDTDRIYATGYASGAFEAYDLTAELSSTFAAVSPVEGSIGECIVNETSHTSVFVCLRWFVK